MKKEITVIEKGIMRITTLDERWYTKEGRDSGGLPTYEFSPSVTSAMNASRVMCPAVRTGRSQKKIMFGFASFSVSRLPSKLIAFASCTKSMSQVSSSAKTGETNIANRINMMNIDFINLTSKFVISRLICS